MTEKDYLLYGIKVLNLKTQEIGLLICLWENKFADKTVDFATCVDKTGKRYNIELDNIRGFEDDFEILIILEIQIGILKNFKLRLISFLYLLLCFLNFLFYQCNHIVNLLFENLFDIYHFRQGCLYLDENLFRELRYPTSGIKV